MAVRFSSLDTLFQTCAEHLDNTGNRGTLIENYFVQHILVRICAEYQVRLTAIVTTRGSRSNDARCLEATRLCLKDACKHFSISDLTGITGRFGGDYKDNFKALINDELKTAWDNIYTNRQNVAHTLAAIGMTLQELENTYRKSLGVLDALITVLEMKPKELKGLR